MGQVADFTVKDMMARSRAFEPGFGLVRQDTVGRSQRHTLRRHSTAAAPQPEAAL